MKILALISALYITGCVNHIEEDRLTVTRVDEQNCLLDNGYVGMPVKCSDKLDKDVANYNQHPHGPSSMSALNMAAPLVSKMVK